MRGKTYRAIDIARIYGIHSNTVRLYEKLGFITKAKRSDNNYRVFEEIHVLQVKVCRCVFGYPFTSKNIRSLGNKTLYAIAEKQWNRANQFTEKYIRAINQEIATAQKASDMLHNWVNSKHEDKTKLINTKMLSRMEAAEYFNVTIESIRNWERNSLIVSCGLGVKREKLYSNDDLDRMCVIYMLLQSGYSIASIHRSLLMFDKGETELVSLALNNAEYEEIVSVGDHWLRELLRLLDGAERIPSIIEEMKNI